MIKLILLGLVATAAVWFVTSKDHVLSIIERDLTQRVVEALDTRGEKQPEFTVTGRDVILFGSGDQSRKDVENAATDVRVVPGVEQVFVIDSFADPDQISRAVVSLTGQDQFVIAAHVQYDGSEISLIGNGTGESATSALLNTFGEKYDVSVNDNLYYQSSPRSDDWTRALSAWVEFLPAAGPGWIVFAGERIVVSMENSRAADDIGEKLSNLGLAFDVDYRTHELAAAKAVEPVKLESYDLKLDNEPVVVVSTSAAALSTDECNRKLSAISKDGSINFQHSADELTFTAVQSLVRVRDILQECGQGMVTVAGHTDSLGDRQFNLELSSTRAGLVVDQLITLGIEPGRLRAIGFGEDRPIASNDTKAGRWLNRRIELTLEQ